MKHDEQLTLFDGARNKLKQLGIKPHLSELKQIENDLAELEKRESDLEKIIILSGMKHEILNRNTGISRSILGLIMMRKRKSKKDPHKTRKISRITCYKTSKCGVNI